MTRKEFVKICGIFGVGLPLHASLSSCEKNDAPIIPFKGKVIIIGAGAGGLSAGYLLQQQGVDFKQWVLRGETIFEYSVGPLKDGGFSKYYKDLLTLKDVPNQREVFESKMKEYLNRGIKQLQDKKII